MRIGIDIRALDARYITGVDSYLRGLLRSFVQENGGHEFAMLGTRRLKDSPEVKALVEAGHRFIEQPLPNKVFNLSMRFFGRPKLDKMLGGVDVMFYPNPMFHAASDKVKKVITFHDLSFERLKSVYSPKRNLWHKIVNPRGEARLADKIIAVSDSTKKDLHRMYDVEESKVDVIPLGVDNEVYSKSSQSLMELPKNYILFMGSLEPRKNTSSLLMAHQRLLAQHPDLHLVLAGSFFPQRDLKALKLALKARNVLMTGPVSEEDKVKMYQQAKIVVLPSLYEGFGLQIIESMAAGTPVITSVSSSMPQTAGGAALLVNPFNLAELSAAIDKLLTNNELRNILTSRGREVAATHTWAETARRTLKVLESV